jgi:hypothetical protein
MALAPPIDAAAVVEDGAVVGRATTLPVLGLAPEGTTGAEGAAGAITTATAEGTRGGEGAGGRAGARGLAGSRGGGDADVRRCWAGVSTFQRHHYKTRSEGGQ